MHNGGDHSDVVSVSFPATFAEVAKVLQRTMVAPALGDLSLARLRDLELVLAESLNNVVEHAYADAGLGEVRLNVSRDAGLVRLEIGDDGIVMPTTFAQGSTGEEPHDEGGRGWLLIRSLCKSVEYQRVSERNRLILEFVSSD